MSTFTCEKCKSVCYDTPRGYVTGCKHYPPDIAAVNDMYKRYLEARSALQELWSFDSFVPDELMKKIKKILNEH